MWWIPRANPREGAVCITGNAFSTQRGSEGCCWDQRGKGKVCAPIGLRVCGLPQKGSERTFTTSSIWASAAHSFVLSWNSEGRKPCRSTLAGGHVFLCWKGMQRDGGFQKHQSCKATAGILYPHPHLHRERCAADTLHCIKKPDASPSFTHTHTPIHVF